MTPGDPKHPGKRSLRIQKDDVTQWTRKRKKVNLPTDSIAILVPSYNTHYNEYIKGRKNITLRIPSKVRKAVHRDYMYMLYDQRASELLAQITCLLCWQQ